MVPTAQGLQTIAYIGFALVGASITIGLWWGKLKGLVKGVNTINETLKSQNDQFLAAFKAIDKLRAETQHEIQRLRSELYKDYPSKAEMREIKAEIVGILNGIRVDISKIWGNLQQQQSDKS